MHPRSSDAAESNPNWFKNVIQNRGIFSDYLFFPKDKAPWFVTILLISVAYYLSFWVRLEWIDFAQAHYENEKGEVVFFHPEMVKDGVALPNTHDSFYFGSILQKAHLGMHENNNLIPRSLTSGMITMLLLDAPTLSGLILKCCYCGFQYMLLGLSACHWF